MEISNADGGEKGETGKVTCDLTKEKHIQIAITRAKEQGLDISESDLIECWLSSSEEDDDSDGETTSKSEDLG
jgi:hypothetical protein